MKCECLEMLNEGTYVKIIRPDNEYSDLYGIVDHIDLEHRSVWIKCVTKVYPYILHDGNLEDIVIVTL